MQDSIYDQNPIERNRNQREHVSPQFLRATTNPHTSAESNSYRSVPEIRACVSTDQVIGCRNQDYIMHE